MKTKNLKTLQLAKKTIAQLDIKNQQNIVGGQRSRGCGRSWNLTSCHAQ